MSQTLRKTLNMTEIEEFLEKIAQGFSISSVCRDFAISPHSLNMMRRDDTLFSEKFAESRQIAAQSEIDEIKEVIEMADGPIELKRAQLLGDHARWKAAKEYRDVYGDKMDVNVHKTLDISDALAHARNRVAPMLHQQNDAQQQLPEVSATYKDLTTGQEPVAAPKKAETIDDIL